MMPGTSAADFGWYQNTEIHGLCAACTWRLEDARMSCCEFGQQEFPKALSCKAYFEYFPEND